jgi:glycosyltransferase involved in cell wall biosynthesis
MKASWPSSPTSYDVARSISFYTDSATFGGAEQALFTLIEALDRRAWTPSLLLNEAPGGPPLARHLDGLDVAVRTVAPAPLGAAGAIRVPSLARSLRRDRPDVFHAHMSWPLAAKYALAAAVLARVPATLGTVQLFPDFDLDRSNFWQLKALAARVGRYIAVSRDIEAQLVERLHWPAEKIDVVYNAARFERFDAVEAAKRRAELSGGGAHPVVLTTARLDPQKGHPVLLRAARELPGVVFALAGDGPDRVALEGQAAALGIGDRVLFLGHRTDVPELLAACDVFVLPSLFEGSSLALLEAMGAGRAVLSSAIGGTGELVVDGEDGVLVPPGDAQALAAGLRKLLDDPALRARLAERAGRRVARDFTPAANCERVTQIYEELIAGA